VRRYVVCAVAVAFLAACGGADQGFTVFAAGPIAPALENVDPQAGFESDTSPRLARQLRDGAGADVYVSSNVSDAFSLFEAGITDRPLTLAEDDVVLAVPRTNPAHISSLRDLDDDNVTVVLARRDTPLGDLTRQGLGGRSFFRDTIEVPTLTAVVGKLATGKANAGFVYRTTVVASQGGLKAVYPITPALYTVSVVRDGDRPAARAFLARLFSSDGRRALQQAGFTTTSESGKPIP
jgi:molybdate transport system substrate-binding protein